MWIAYETIIQSKGKPIPEREKPKIIPGSPFYPLKKIMAAKFGFIFLLGLDRFQAYSHMISWCKNR